MGFPRQTRGYLVVFVAVGLAVGCTALVGVGVGVGLITTAALTSGCYDPVEVTVIDGVTGLPTCDASVVARSRDGGVTRFAPCFHLDLPVGAWVVVAERRGYQTALTELPVSKGAHCEPAPQTVELWLRPLGQAAPAPYAVPPPRPGEQPLTPGSLPAPGSMNPVEQPLVPAPAPAPAPSGAGETPAPAEPPMSAAPVPPVPPPPAAPPKAAP